MFVRLLVPIDGTDTAERAMTASIALAAQLQAAIVGFIAEPDLRAASDRPSSAVAAKPLAIAGAASHAQKALDQFQARAAAAQIPFEGVMAYTAEVVDAIIQTAQQQSCDLIVMVTHGRGAFGERLFGSHTKSVMSRCKLPLLVLH